MIDTHAHLLYYDDVDNLINSMKGDNLSAIVSIGTNLEDSKQTISLVQNYDNVYATAGFYPEYAETFSDQDFIELEKIAKNSKVVAIGEIGLDYHTAGYNREKQIEVFIKQLEIANKLGLPICIHCRNAAEDVYQILKENKHLLKHSGLMHCYSEGNEWIERFVELGMFISLSGNITYKKVDLSFLKKIPLDKLLVETDSPYLTPVPFRGQKNEPKHVRFVIEKIANELGMTFEEVEKITEKNAKSFYFNMKKV